MLLRTGSFALMFIIKWYYYLSKRCYVADQRQSVLQTPGYMYYSRCTVTDNNLRRCRGRQVLFFPPCLPVR